MTTTRSDPGLQRVRNYDAPTEPPFSPFYRHATRRNCTASRTRENDTLFRASRAHSGMTERGPLAAVSPLDGRYAGDTAPLVPYASERALMRARVEVEVEYLIALADLDATPLSIDDGQRATLRALYEEFDDEDASVVKQLDEGYGEYSATNHDVKAVEYFVRPRRQTTSIRLDSLRPHVRGREQPRSPTPRQTRRQEVLVPAPRDVGNAGGDGPHLR